MAHLTIDLLEDDDDDAITTVTPWELSLTDLPREADGDDDDDLGLRSLYERPEALLGPDDWPDAA